MKIYFMGICGTAMGHAALLLRQAGHTVIGADNGVYPPMSTVLQAAGIEILSGYDPVRLAALRPDLVVVGNAQSRGHPEVEWLLETRALPYTSLPALLQGHILHGRRNLVIAGTHGKTTTTSIAAWILQENGHRPGWLIGGVPRQPEGGAQLGGGPGAPFAIEGDEYDSAFFDKRSKFIHYDPTVVVLNNLEFDHADIFHDLRDYRRSFLHLTRVIPRSGWIVANADDPEVAALAAECRWTQVVRTGTGDAADLRICDFQEGPQGASFRLIWKGKDWATVRWGLPGLFNARNAASAALGAALIAHPEDPTRLDLSPLNTFVGVKRRQEILRQDPGIAVIEDFGHHPTALRETLRSLRARWTGRRIWAAFEPRSNSSRTKVFQDAFAEALAEADRTFIGAVARATQLSPGQALETESLAEAIRARGRLASAHPSNQDLCDSMLAAHAADPVPTVAAFFTNGSFDGIIPRFAREARG